MSKGKTIALIVVIVGGVIAVAIAACGGLIYWGYKSSAEVASPRVDDFFTAVNDSRSAELYANDMSTGLRAAHTKEQFAELCELYKTRLGRLQSKTMTSFNRQQHNADSTIEVAYSATFEKGSGTIQATLIDEGGTWKFNGIHVESPALVSGPAPVKTESMPKNEESAEKTPH